MVMTCGYRNYSDEHYTADHVAEAVVRHFSPRGKCLEPFKGEGAFFRHMPAGTDWCEIRDGRDFFKYSVPCDWIVTNPPFSNLTKVFEHAFNLAGNCVFVIPISKYWSSAPRIESVARYGGLVEIAHLGRGRDIGFDIGFPFAAMYFKRGYHGHIRQTILTPNKCKWCGHSIDAHDRQYGCAEDGCDCETPNARLSGPQQREEDHE